MRRWAVKFLLVARVSQVRATERADADTQLAARSADSFVDSSVQQLFDRALRASPLDALHCCIPGQLENATLGKGPSTVSGTKGSTGASRTIVPPDADIRTLKREYGLSGVKVKNGRYLLGDKAMRVNSKGNAGGTAQIYAAYRADERGVPIGDRLIMKLGVDCERLARESQNYDRVKVGLFPGRFVDKIDYLPELDPDPPSGAFANRCGLILEAADRDLAGVLKERGGRGLEGRALRDAAAAAAQCVQAVHSSGLVWGDIKSQNFVVVGDEIGDSGSLPGVKGIDVESCEPHKSNPRMYTAAYATPEFARTYKDGTAGDFILEYSYDIFGYGLLLYELATGKGYFARQGMRGDSRVLGQMAVEEFVADVSAVEDEKLRDLIEQCLRDDPKKRPSIVQVLLHPYFITTGIGAYGFKDAASKEAAEDGYE